MSYITVYLLRGGIGSMIVGQLLRTVYTYCICLCTESGTKNGNEYFEPEVSVFKVLEYVSALTDAKW